MRISSLFFHILLSTALIKTSVFAAIDTPPFTPKEISPTNAVAEEIDKEAKENSKEEEKEVQQIQNKDTITTPYFSDSYVSETHDSDRFTAELMKMFGILAVFVTCMLILSRMLKKMTETKIDQLNTTSPIKILDRRSLSPKAMVYVIEIHNKTLAVAETPNGITKLAELDSFQNEEE